MTFHSVGNNDPNWRTHNFQRGRSTTNQIRSIPIDSDGFASENGFPKNHAPFKRPKKTYEKPWTMKIPLGDNGAKLENAVQIQAGVFRGRVLLKSQSSKTRNFLDFLIHGLLNEWMKNGCHRLYSFFKINSIDFLYINEWTQKFSRVQHQCWLMISCGIILTNILGIRIK